MKYLHLLLSLPIWHLRGSRLVKNSFAVSFGWLTRGRWRPKKVVLRNGWKIYLSDHPHDIITVFVIFFKQDYKFEGKTLDNILDGGANIGVFSIWAALNGAADIHAFEASPSTFKFLEKNVLSNGLSDIIKIYNEALWEKNDDLIYIDDRSSPHNRVFEDIGNNKGVPIKTESLDNWLSKNDRLDWIIKLDIEGAESAVLRSFSKHERVRAFLIEYHNKDAHDESLALKEKGFNIVKFEPDSRDHLGIIHLHRI